jgi:phosphatidylethanolamine/phosphatidyl-N-methylethanolamine N-methyltransferase
MSSETPSFYNRFAVYYPIVDLFLRPQKARLFQEINRLPDGDLLDIGVGNGAHFPLYERHHITGIDTSPGMLKIASKRAHSRIQLMLMNGEALAFGDSGFDYVVLSHVIAVVDDPERLVEEIFRVLKPNGRLYLLNHFTPDNWLKHVDRAFGIFSKSFHFQSVFHLHQITAIARFKLLEEVHFNPLSYFKLLVYEKK